MCVCLCVYVLLVRVVIVYLLRVTVLVATLCITYVSHKSLTTKGAAICVGRDTVNRILNDIRNADQGSETDVCFDATCDVACQPTTNDKINHHMHH